MSSTLLHSRERKGGLMAVVQISLKIDHSLLRTLTIQAGKFSTSRQELIAQYLRQGIQSAEETHPGISARIVTREEHQKGE